MSDRYHHVGIQYFSLLISYSYHRPYKHIYGYEQQYNGASHVIEV